MAYAHQATNYSGQHAVLSAEIIAWAGTILLVALALPYLKYITAYLLMLWYDIFVYH